MTSFVTLIFYTYSITTEENKVFLKSKIALYYFIKWTASSQIAKLKEMGGKEGIMNMSRTDFYSNAQFGGLLYAIRIAAAEKEYDRKIRCWNRKYNRRMQKFEADPDRKIPTEDEIRQAATKIVDSVKRRENTLYDMEFDDDLIGLWEWIMKERDTAIPSGAGEDE